MAFNPLKLFNRQQPVSPAAGEAAIAADADAQSAALAGDRFVAFAGDQGPAEGATSAIAAEILLEDPEFVRNPNAGVDDTTNQRGSVQFEDVQVGRALPEVGDEVVVNMLNNKNPELTRYENMAQDGGFGPEVLSLDKSSPKLAEAVASSDEGFGPEVLSLDKSSPKLAEAVASSDEGIGPEGPLAGKSTPILFEAVAQPETTADGILPYLEQQPYHGGGEAMQDVFVTEAVAPAQDVFVTEVVSPPPTEGQVSVFGVGGGVDEAARTGSDSARYENMLVSEVVAPTAPQAQDVFITEFSGSDDQMRELVARLQQRGLIDTSTGEVVWADEATSNFTGSDEELGALIAWLQGNNLIDTSTGEIVWARQPGEGSQWFVPDMDSDQSGMAIDKDQVFVGGFGGGADDDRVVQPDQPQSLYFEDSVRTAREVAAGDVNGDGIDTVGASTLLDPTEPAASLNFEEIKVTIVDTADVDLDPGDADIEIPD